MKLSDIIIIIFLAIVFFILFFKIDTKDNLVNNKNKNYGNKDKVQIPINNLEYMPVVDMIGDIEDKPIELPNETKPFDITSNIPINNTYDVQPGLYDQQPLPIKVIEQPVSEKIYNTLDNETQSIEHFNEEEKTISQLYDELVESNNIKPTPKESLNTTDRILQGHKGYTLDINNWTLYKNDTFLNGGNYDTLVGINQFEKNNIYRIADNYNDFEIQEFI